MILSINVRRSSLFYVQDDESQNAPQTVCKMLLAESENAFPTEKGASLSSQNTPKQGTMKQEQEFVKTQTSPESHDNFK